MSPHLDDAVLSLGGTIGEMTQIVRVDVVTMFAYNPEVPGLVDPWDIATGFATSRDAAAARRDEDSAACRVLGANPVWLPFDAPMPPPDSDDLIAMHDALRDALSMYSAVAIPGFPCCIIRTTAQSLGSSRPSWTDRRGLRRMRNSRIG